MPFFTRFFPTSFLSEQAALKGRIITPFSVLLHTQETLNSGIDYVHLSPDHQNFKLQKNKSKRSYQEEKQISAFKPLFKFAEIEINTPANTVVIFTNENTGLKRERSARKYY